MGAAAVLIGTIGAIVMSEVREQFSNERISVNEKATAQATAESDIAKRDAAMTAERAALAEQRAAEANLELAKLKTPRFLTIDALQHISEQMKPFASVPFTMGVFNDPEAIDLMIQIDSALVTDGWQETEWKSGGDIVLVSNCVS